MRQQRISPLPMLTIPWQWVYWSVHELVELGVVGKETHTDSIWLGHEECGTDSFSRYVHLCNDVFVDKILNNTVRLGLVSEGNAACNDLLMGCSEG